MFTRGWSAADLFGFISGVGFAGGLVGYMASAARQALGKAPHFVSFAFHTSMIAGFGAGAFVIFDRVLH